MYASIVQAVREYPGLTGAEMAARLDKSKEYTLPLLFQLKKYCGALRLPHPVWLVQLAGLGDTDMD
jgi:hypothetical protein